MRPSIIAPVVASILSVGIVLAIGWAILNRQYVADQVTIWAYQPAASIETIEDRIQLTDEGAFYFRASQPEVATAETFNQDCPRQESGSPILGCYASGRIFIYDVENEDLDGIEEVTAAHEMLHAAWERMSDSDREKIEPLLEAAYDDLADAELQSRMEYYHRTEPGQFYNELHSILPTEFKTLSPDLETYYKKYFKNRSIVIQLFEQYDGVFDELTKKAERLYQDLTELGKSLETKAATYQKDVTALSADIDDFNRRADSGDFSSIYQFNVERNALIARTNELEAQRTAINRDIATYNKKYDQYQAVATEIKSLNESIDSISNLAPAPSID